jgi:predicted amidophosphoribosyltransferase
VTTGATVSAGAAVLRDAGADAVTVCALARTPAKSHHAE